MDEPTLRFEIDRYLGWPGQAPSYKVGERIWLEARDAMRELARALRSTCAGSMRRHSVSVHPGLDPLRAALDRL